MLYLFLGLKIPLLLLYWLVYWAIKAEPEPEDAGGDGGSRKERPHRRCRRCRARHPLPRRGPLTAGALPLPPAPARPARHCSTRSRVGARDSRGVAGAPAWCQLRRRVPPSRRRPPGRARSLAHADVRPLRRHDPPPRRGGPDRHRPWDPGLVQPASVDLRLGDSFRVFHNHRAAAIDLREPPTNLTEEVVVRRRAVRDPPGRVRARAHAGVRRAARRHRRPDRGQSSASAGSGLIVHATAGFVDPGFKGTLTLEITNLTRSRSSSTPGC